MGDYKVELGLYHDCLYEIKRRLDVIADHLGGKTKEKYRIIEAEVVSLQFRKILEMTALMSLVANKEAYAEQNEKFARHYHAERIINDLERINPNFYPCPIMRIEQEGNFDRLENLTEGFLTKEEFVKVYEKCGAMMHAHNPFGDKKAGDKLLEECEALFPEWYSKICILLKHHRIELIGGKAMVIGLLERSDNGLPQAIIMEAIEEDQYSS